MSPALLHLLPAARPQQQGFDGGQAKRAGKRRFTDKSAPRSARSQNIHSSPQDRIMDKTTPPLNPLTPAESAALERLLKIAKADTGPSRRAADFLLAWWNPASCGHFDFTNLWGVDDGIAVDICTVFSLIARIHDYPDSLGYGEQFRAVVHAWRPELQD
jgi:hypothetical protein